MDSQILGKAVHETFKLAFSERGATYGRDWRVSHNWLPQGEAS